ncbi:MAG: MFS transporter [Candidatus Aenigmarchaeota archaeon]|nr:MFS transporter [Candidatus Aenigmarchaeota archaeon]
MSLLTHVHVHQFFKNKELNHFYVSVAIMTFGQALISIFVPIYLYKLGYPIHSIIFFYFLVSLCIVVFAYSGAKIVSKVGVKHSVLLSVPFVVIYYIGLLLLQNNMWLFFILPILLAWHRIFYFYGYHINYITHSERGKRGKEISFIGTISIAMHIIAPLTGGIITYYYDFAFLYVVGSIILLLGTIPLFFSKDDYEKIEFNSKSLLDKMFSKKERGTLVSFSAYAVESIIGRVIWPIFLITILLTIEKTGLVVTLSMIVSLFVFYFMGKITDKYDKTKLLNLGTLLYFFAWTGRVFVDSSTKIIAIDSYKNITEKILHVPWSAQSYDLAVQRGYFRFIVSREIIFNLSRVVLMPLLMVVFFFEWHSFAISFLIAALFSTGYIFLNKD